MKKLISISATMFFVFTFCFVSVPAFAKMGTGKVVAKSSDVDIKIFGSLHTYPTYVSNPDFNKGDTKYDFVLDENGFQTEYNVRNEARLGLAGYGENWTFLMIFEADFTYNKQNGDRGADATDPLDSGMTGEDFGIEKLEFTYNFGPFTLETGWQTKYLDLKTGGLLYGDDHPFIGIKGKYNDISWEILSLYIFDEIKNLEHGKVNGPIDADSLDWRAYTAKVIFPFQGLNISPFYAFSDNAANSARVHYLGAEAYGKLGMVTPRVEFVYAVGNKGRDVGSDYDISAFAAFAALEFEVSPYFKPYIGGYYVSGDDDANDDDIDAFNPITNISRYAPTFGMENAFIYKYVPVLGSHLYSNVPDLLGGAKTGYGGIGDTSSKNSPGMISFGVGAKGNYGKWYYKAQFQYFWFDETGAIEDFYNVPDIDKDIGMEFDLQVVYKFGKHFSIGDVISIFDPGDGIQDIYGDDYDETAIMNTVELKWQF